MSGPLMGHWPSEWQREDRVSRYVEFMCFGLGRFLMLKVGSDKPGRLGNLPRELWAIAEPLGWRAPLRRHGPRAKSCSAAWLDLTLLPPEQAAERAGAELEALSAVLDK